MNVYLENIGGSLRFYYQSRYATGSMPVNTPQELVDRIEEVCGKGSYCFYRRPADGSKYPAVIDYHEYINYTDLPRLTYWQQGVKTGVIEQCREVAKEVWGRIPEMGIGWLEDQCTTFVD